MTIEIDQFVIAPFQGVGKLRLGLNREAIERVAGKPIQPAIRTRSGNQQLLYPEFILTFDSVHGSLQEICLLPGTMARLQDVSLFADPAVIERLWEKDPSSHEDVGFIVYPRLGLALVDFLDTEPGNRKVLVCADGVLETGCMGQPFDGRGIRIRC